MKLAELRALLEKETQSNDPEEAAQAQETLTALDDWRAAALEGGMDEATWTGIAEELFADAESSVAAVVAALKNATGGDPA